MSRGSRSTTGYWVVVSLLCVFGLIAIFSIGMPLLLLGVTLAVVAPWRTQRAVLWPAVTAVLAFVVGYILVAPLSCSSTESLTLPTQSTTRPAQSTTCTNVLGIDYSGDGLYNPSLGPALLTGLTLSLVAAMTVRVILTRRDRHASPPQEATSMLSDDVD